MIAAGIVRLRVFSGPHLGAEIVLPRGDTLIGSDDSCDIILMDPGLAARHALLRINAAESDVDTPPDVRIMPMDSAVLIGDKPVTADGAPWPASVPCLLGSTILAWAPAAQTDEPWQPVMAALSAQPSPQPLQPSPAEESPTQLADTNTVTETTEDAKASVTPLRRSGYRLFRVALVVLCLGSLAVSYEFRPAPSGINHHQLTEILRENGFSTLKVSPSEEMATVHGTVDSDAQRAQVLRLAQSLQIPVYLDLHVRTDRSSALAHAFAQRGLFPEVTEVSDNGNLLVRGYIKDAQTEDAAFTALLEDFHAAGKLSISRTIKHAKDVMAVLEPLLDAEDLDFAHVEFLPGVVTFAGTFAEGQRLRLQETMNEVQQTLEVPVPFKIVPGKPQTLTVRTDVSRPAIAPTPLSPAQTRTEAPQPLNVASILPDRPQGVSDADTIDLKVTGVTLTPMRFITLGTGERIFEGGLLPSGHVVEGIGTQELRLRKDGGVTIYRLRGSDE